MECPDIDTIIVVGCGRNGTSAVAQLLDSAGYALGNDSPSADQANPLGYFQDLGVMSLNEEVLETILPHAVGLPLTLGWDQPRKGQRWLLRIPAHVVVRASLEQQAKIHNLLSQRTLTCIKDPRLCYTLNCWTEALPHHKVICVFRHPGSFVSSLFKLCQTSPIYSDFAVSVGQAYDIWKHAYDYVLTNFARDGWLFVAYEELLSSLGLAKLQAFVGRPLSRERIRAELSRSSVRYDVPRGVERTYRELRGRASAR